MGVCSPNLDVCLFDCPVLNVHPYQKAIWGSLVMQHCRKGFKCSLQSTKIDCGQRHSQLKNCVCDVMISILVVHYEDLLYFSGQRWYSAIWSVPDARKLDKHIWQTRYSWWNEATWRICKSQIAKIPWKGEPVAALVSKFNMISDHFIFPCCLCWVVVVLIITCTSNYFFSGWRRVCEEEDQKTCWSEYMRLTGIASKAKVCC